MAVRDRLAGAHVHGSGVARGLWFDMRQQIIEQGLG